MLSRLSTNSLWLLIARLGTQAGLALSTILLARQLGNAAFGEYAFIASVVLVGNVVTTFGTDMHLIREIAAADAAAPLAAALRLQLALSTIFIALVLVVSGFLRGMSPSAIEAMRIYSLSIIPLAYFTVYSTALRGRQQMLAYSLLNLALVIMQVAAIFTLIWLHAGLIVLAVLLLVVQCLAALVAAGLARLPSKSLRLPASDIAQIITLAKASAPIAVLAVAGILYQRLSLLMLPSLAGASATGWFSAAARLVEAAKLGHVAAFTALYPLMAQARSASSSDFTRSFRFPFWFLLASATIAAVVISAFSAPLTGILYGAGYAGAAPLLRIIAWCLVPYSVNGFLTLVFLARGHTLAILRALAAATLTLAVATLWLVAAIGTRGAALAALAGETAQAVVLTFEYFRVSHPALASFANPSDLPARP